MSMFDYKDYGSEKSVRLLNNTSELFLTNWYITSSNQATLTAPTINSETGLSDWTILTPSTLGLPDSVLDANGTYKIESPVTGFQEGGPQAQIFGKYNSQGQLANICVAYFGMNSLTDLPDLFQLNSGELAPYLNPLLNTVKDLAIANNLTGKDMLVTGTSLGGALTNMTAEYRDTLADGFFKDSDYVAFESPLIYTKETSAVLNFGFENDVVYRILGDNANFNNAYAQMNPLLSNSDLSFQNTMDNTVFFDDVYASNVLNTGPFSILNLLTWSPHVSAPIGVPQILNNPFYELMDKDSTIILAGLSDSTRSTTWVEDKQASTSNHYGTAAFIIGSEKDDLLKGGKSDDYIFGGTGSDKIQTGAGVDRVDGGMGANTVQLTGVAADWATYHLSDGSTFFAANTGGDLKQVENIQHVMFEGNFFNANHTYEIGDKALMDKSNFMFGMFNKNITYEKATEGTVGNDTLTGKAVFGQDGNDILNAKVGVSSLLHGGEGNDVLKGSTSNDELYGAEGDDTLHGSKGSDVLYGGVGDDNFLFNLFGGTTQIMDFNSHEGDADTISFSSSVFKDYRSVIAATHQVGDDVLIKAGAMSINIHSANVIDVLQHVYVI